MSERRRPSIVMAKTSLPEFVVPNQCSALGPSLSARKSRSMWSHFWNTGPTTANATSSTKMPRATVAGMLRK